jgi:hypothetical protein
MAHCLAYLAIPTWMKVDRHGATIPSDQNIWVSQVTKGIALAVQVLYIRRTRGSIVSDTLAEQDFHLAKPIDFDSS